MSTPIPNIEYTDPLQLPYPNGKATVDVERDVGSLAVATDLRISGSQVPSDSLIAGDVA